METMNTNAKILLTTWITAIATFGFSAAYILSQSSRINAPGELREVFSATGFILLLVLVIISGIALLATKTK